MAQATHSPDPANIGTGAGQADLDNGGYKPPVVAATGATAGTPGTWTPSGATPAPNLAGMSSIAPSPSTAWTVGQRVVMGDSNATYWNGTAWTAGQAPVAQAKASTTEGE